MKKAIWILLVIAILGGSLVAYKATRSEKGVHVTTEKATRGDITSEVTASGQVFPESEVKISSEVPGEIIDLPVADGQAVSKGDILVVVNPDQLESKVLQQEASLKATQANASEAKARMLQIELDLQRVKALFENGFATQEAVQAAQTQYEVSKASHASAQYRIQQQEMSLKEAKDSLSKATTYAPIDGTVTKLSSELGDRVVGTGQFAGTEIMRIANLERMEVRVDVSEADIVKVSIGDEAKIEIEAISDKTFKGIVTEIANSAQSSRNNNDQLTTFQVKIRLTDPSEAIRPGMTAIADIKTDTAHDIVKVPLQSVTIRSKKEVAEQLKLTSEQPREEDPADPQNPDKKKSSSRKKDDRQRLVFIFREDKVVLTPVETGISDNRFIEIKSGVSEGDTIVTGSYRVLTRELKHDMPVTIAKKEKNGKGKTK